MHNGRGQTPFTNKRRAAGQAVAMAHAAKPNLLYHNAVMSMLLVVLFTSAIAVLTFIPCYIIIIEFDLYFITASCTLNVTRV